MREAFRSNVFSKFLPFALSIQKSHTTREFSGPNYAPDANEVMHSVYKRPHCRILRSQASTVFISKFTELLLLVVELVYWKLKTLNVNHFMNTLLCHVPIFILWTAFQAAVKNSVRTWRTQIGVVSYVLPLLYTQGTNLWCFLLRTSAAARRKSRDIFDSRKLESQVQIWVFVCLIN